MSKHWKVHLKNGKCINDEEMSYVDVSKNTNLVLIGETAYSDFRYAIPVSEIKFMEFIKN